MTESSDKKAAAIADLLNKLADLSGDEAALAACRREADMFDPSLSTAVIALDLLAIETDSQGRREALGFIVRLQEHFQANGDLAAAERIVEGLEKIGGEGRP